MLVLDGVYSDVAYITWLISQTGPALGMFEVFGRTGMLTLGGAPFWTIKIPYKLTCQFERPEPGFCHSLQC